MLGFYTYAITSFKHALAIKFLPCYEKEFDISDVYLNPGNAYERIDQHKLAIKNYAEVITRNIRKNSNKARLIIAMGCTNIGCTYVLENNYDNAIQYHHYALALRSKVLGNNNPDVADSHHNLGVAYTPNGNQKKAIQHYKEAVAIYERTLGPSHPFTQGTQDNLALVQQDMRRAFE